MQEEDERHEISQIHTTCCKKTVNKEEKNCGKRQEQFYIEKSPKEGERETYHDDHVIVIECNISLVILQNSTKNL